MQFATKLTVPLVRDFNLRAELRLALLAAAESCWLYALVLTLGTIAHLQVVSPLGIFLVYMTGLVVGRILPTSQRAWRVLQGVTIAVGMLVILVAMRIGFYTNLPLWDFGWLPTYVHRLVTIWESFSGEELSTFALVLILSRALNFAQRPLTLWVVGFQFRLGIVFFFGTAILAAVAAPVNFVVWLFVYFGFSLIGISLARIEEAGQERPLGGKWALVMLSVIGATMLLGFVVTQLLTLNTVNAFFELLSPLRIVVQILFTLIAIPIFYIFAFIIQLLTPLFDMLRNALTGIFPNLHLNNEETARVVNEVAQRLSNLIPYLRYVGLVGVFVLLGLIIARALNRRVKWREEELFAVEASDERDQITIERRQRAVRARARHGEIHAENVRRIYAALLAEAEAGNLPRREAETPLEFLPRLTARFPESGAALETITNAYVAVHYAQQIATDAQVRDLRALWQRTRQQMRERKKSSVISHQ